MQNFSIGLSKKLSDDMTQAFTPELCAHLSSIIPGFEGHYGYYKFYDDSESVACHEEIWWIEKHREFTQVRRKKPELICPAWQVEDVLRNWSEIEKYCVRGQGEVGVGMIALRLYQNSDTAYQKIEEYLWTILK